jgi:hypothetical protein
MLVESGTVPVPVASGLDELVALGEVEELAELEEAELFEEEEPLDPDEVEVVELLVPPFRDCSADCTALLSWVLTRLNAVWLAILARPVDRFVIAELITLMTASVCAREALVFEARLQ